MNPPLTSTARLEHRFEANLEMNEIIARHGQKADITTRISGLTVRHIIELCSNQSLAYHQQLNDRNIPGVASKIARETIFRLINNGVLLNQEPFTEEQENRDVVIMDAISDEFDRWWLQKDTYVRSSSMPSEHAFIKKHGPIDWSKAMSSIYHAGYRAPSPEQTVADEAAECVMNIETGFRPMKGVSREVYDRVRSAKVVSFSHENIDELIPKIEISYNHTWLKPEAIDKLEKGDLSGFRHQTEKGVFVFGFDEEPDHNMSVKDQLIHDVKNEYNSNEPSYQGKCLMDDDGNILAYFTYWQPPENPSKRNANMIKNYLRKGVTGGRMNYSTSPSRSFLERFTERTLLIDTIRGEVPFAAARLMAKTTHKMHHHSRYLSHLIGYRLHELHFRPSLDAGSEYVRLGENDSSGKFFGDRGCYSFATDFNKKGTSSVRMLPDGGEVHLTPEWIWFVGRFGDVMHMSRNRWDVIRTSYGDLSADDK